MTRANTKPERTLAGDNMERGNEKTCPVCGEKTEVWFGVEGLIPFRLVHRMCRCEREKWEAKEADRAKRETERKIAVYRERGLTDAQYLECTFSADDEESGKVSQFCRKYVENWDWARTNSAGILLWGDVGGGKTFYAACIANALIDKGIPVVMTTIPRLTASMQRDFGSGRESVLSMVADIPLLILDDVGTERDTEFSNEAAYEIVNERYKSRKPLVVTTNLTPAAMRGATDATQRRIYDRLIEMCAPLKVPAKDRRKAAAQDKLNRMMEQFGMR